MTLAQIRLEQSLIHYLGRRGNKKLNITFSPLTEVLLIFIQSFL